MQINFIYEVKHGKYLIWNLQKNKIIWKKYYYWDLADLEIDKTIDLYLKDQNFEFQSKSFEHDGKNKIWIQDIEANLNTFEFWKNIFIWYTINNISANGEKSNIILWKSWNITYNIWIYSLNQVNYNKILKVFGKNVDFRIYPTSFHFIKQIWDKLADGAIVYMLKNNTKIISLEKWFYKNIEEINIWTKDFRNTILWIFGKELQSLANLSDFNRKVYEKELDKFLEPIKIFVKNACKNDKIYVIWNFDKTPILLEKLGKSTHKAIVPMKIWNKNCTTTEQTDIFYIRKN